MPDPGPSLTPCPQGRTDYEACFAPFRYCPEKGCGRMEQVEPEQPVPTYLDGLREARAVVERQTDLTELVHFDRPSDFRKGVLTCLVALDKAIEETTQKGSSTQAERGDSA